VEVPLGMNSTRGASPSAEPAELQVRPLGEHPGLRVAGEVGMHTRGVWQGALAELARQGVGAVHVDLGEVVFIDVGGVTDLVMCAQGLPEGGRIVVRRPPLQLARILETFWPELDVIEVAS
jgi:hypothetical protein